MFLYKKKPRICKYCGRVLYTATFIENSGSQSSVYKNKDGKWGHHNGNNCDFGQSRGRHFSGELSYGSKKASN